MKKSGILVLFIIMFSITFISATTDDYTGSFSQQGAEYVTDGLVINLITPHSSILNQNLFMYASVYGLDGKLKDNSSVTCIFGIISQQGDRLLLLDQNNFSYGLSGAIWVIPIPGYFLNSSEIYNYNFNCEETVRGGYFQGQLHISRIGAELGVPEAIVYIILSFGILLLSMITFYFMLLTPYSNKLNEKGNLIMKVTRTKYIKLGLILITYGLFTWFLNIMIGLSENFASLTMYYGLFGGIFWIMNALSLPVAIVIIVIMLFEIVRDANIQKNIKALGSATR